MSVILRRVAVDRLVTAVRAASADDLVEVSREFDPTTPVTFAEAERNLAAVRQSLVDRICGSLPAEQIIDLWNVVFPTDARVWFDGDDDTLHYESDVEPVALADW